MWVVLWVDMEFSQGDPKRIALFLWAKTKEVRPQMEMRILREPKVVTMVGISRSTIWRMEKDGLFPKRLKISPGAIGWLEKDINEWIEGRAAASGNEAA